jgi:hypothetical protein
VTQKLPEKQRTDIEKELAGLIEDMLADRVQDREATQKDVEAVLLELGDPALLADKYRGYQRFLIGPELFPMYWMVLKIVLMAIGLAMTVVFAIQAIITPAQGLHFLVSSLAGFWMGGIQGFAWVTAVFALIEYLGIRKGKIGFQDEHDWTPADLPSLPEIERQIPRADPIAGIIFTVLFVALITFDIHLFGIWIFQSGQPGTVIPFFDKAVFQGFLPYIWAVTALTILDEVLKLTTGKWTLGLIAFGAARDILNFALAVFMFSSPAIWNSNFMQQMTQVGLAPAGEGFRTFSTAWGYATQNMIYLIGVIFVLQMIATAVKMLRMRNVVLKDRPAISSTL